MKKHRPAKVPKMTTDEEAEVFLEQDLSDYIHAGNFKRVTFEFMPKTEKMNLRIPAEMLAALKKRAARAKMPYQRYLRHIIEQDLRGQ